MQVERVTTEDGSHTLFVPGLNEHYHSVHGAVTESQHVFIASGLNALNSVISPVRILEIGFGTGLNALLTQIVSETRAKATEYTALEPFPLPEDLWKELNYARHFCAVDYSRVFGHIHLADWEKRETISPHFSLRKIKRRLEEFDPGKENCNLIYFDAFGPDVQPELWSEANFRKLFESLVPGGILVTYSVKGSVRRALKAAGFAVEKIAGPPGKREITRALK
jgi:tRNA U34 5-methylaminomethyl-2-thiouridine-forming methyltransferase MnmC